MINPFILKANRTLLTSLMFVVLLTPHAKAAAPVCADLFKPAPAEQLVTRAMIVADLLAKNERAYKQGKTEQTVFLNRELSLLNEFKMLLEATGLSFRVSKGEFEILPVGTHRLAKIAAGLNRQGIKLKISPRIIASGTLGGYVAKTKTVYLDLETVFTGKVGYILTHESRHAYNDLRSFETDGLYERLFQTFLIGEATPRQQLPEMRGTYKSRFSLDEILAYRQSAMQLVRELMKNPSDESTIQKLIVHCERIKLFVDSGLTTLRSLRQEVDSSNFDYQVNDFPNQAFSKVEVQVVEQGFFKRWFSRHHQDNNLIGLIAKFTASWNELPADQTPSTMRSFLLERIDTTIAELEALQPAAHQIFESIKPFGEKRAITERDLNEVESALRELLETIAQRRRALPQ